MRASNLFTALLLAALLWNGGCAKASYTGRTQVIIPKAEADAIQMGVVAAQQNLATQKIETGTPRAERVERIGREIAKVSGKPQYNWQFYTVDSAVPNAVCYPGGIIFYHTSLLNLYGDNDAEVAFVMGHEVAHAIALHGAEQKSQTTLARAGVIAASIAAGLASRTPLATAKNSESVLTTIARVGVLLPYNRLQESEADHIGLILMAEAGYDPHAAISAWEKMMGAYPDSSQFAFLRTHPLNADRLENMRKLLPEALKHYRPPEKTSSEEMPE